MLKKDSAAWQLAVKQSKRKSCNSVPVKLNHDGSVRMFSLVRGVEWDTTLQELVSLETGRYGKTYTQGTI